MVWVLPSHVRVPAGLQVFGGVGEGVVPPLQMVVPTSGSSLHFPLMQMSWPEQSFRVLHGPEQPERAVPRSGRAKKEREMERKMRFAI